MNASIKRIGPEPPTLNRDYKKRPKPVTGHGKYIKVLETVYKPPKYYEFPPETPERRQRIIESQRKAREKREQADKPKRKPRQNRVWTPEKIERFKTLYSQGLTYPQIAREMGMKPTQINAKGLSIAKCAKTLHMSTGSVEARLRREAEKC